MKISTLLFAAALLLVFGGCKKDEKQPEKPAQQSNSNDDRQGGERDDQPMPWPPPGGQKAPAPPGVQQLMANMANAINAGDHAAVHKFFMNRLQFMGVSDCDPKDVVDRVLEGRQNAVDKVKAGKNAVTFKEFTDGYFFDVKRGDKPAECRAKVDVKLYMARYKWVWNGELQDGEAHFLESSGAWFFVKM